MKVFQVYRKFIKCVPIIFIVVSLGISRHGLANSEGSCLAVKTPFCNCTGNTLICGGLQQTDIEDFFTVVDSSLSATKLKLIDSELVSLPAGLFHRSGITHFRIENTLLPFLSFPDGRPGPFQSGSSLSDFTVNRVKSPYNWNWTLLSTLRNLNALRIVSSDFVYINPSFKSINSSSLQVLVIESSQVRWISDGAFANFPALSFFHAINNGFTVFKRSYLPTPASFLSLISLKNNRLTNVEEGLFSDMPQLAYVNLENNQLVTLSEKVLPEKMRKRLFIDLAGNPFHCDCSISWMKKKPANLDINRIRCINLFHPEGIFYWSINWFEMGC